MRPAEKGMAGKEERALSFDCKQSWSGFFAFKMVKSYVLCMGVANVHVKKSQGLAFHRTGDRPEALLCPIVMKSVTKKTSECVGFFFSKRAHQYHKTFRRIQ